MRQWRAILMLRVFLFFLAATAMSEVDIAVEESNSFYDDMIVITQWQNNHNAGPNWYPTAQIDTSTEHPEQSIMNNNCWTVYVFDYESGQEKACESHPALRQT